MIDPKNLPASAPQTSPMGSARAFAMTVAYKGTNYGGWQMQPNSITIQQRLEEAITKLTGERARVIGSGRTDAGVHAIAQVASFQLMTWKATAASLVPAINLYLPPDIAVRQCRETQLTFHAIIEAIDKEYCYTIRNSYVPDPLNVDFHYRIKRELNVDAMQTAANFFHGRHDFWSFEAKGSPRKSTEREILHIGVECRNVREGREIDIRVRADGFLYNMVRNMVGALIEIGNGRQSPDWIRDLLSRRHHPQRFTTVPPTGLCMQHVSYDPKHFIDPNKH
jgi:tRNA pseudouridine38-40 synthase